MQVKRNKQSKLGTARHIIQFVAFLLFPGLFISAFSALKELCISWADGSFDGAALSQQLILAGAVLLITALMGRFFCGFLCSFGAMGDLLWFAGKKLKLPRPNITESADRLLKLLKYAVLLGIVAFVWTGLAAVDSLWNPWTIFGMYASVKGWPAVSYLISVGGLLLLLIIIGSFFVERPFCRYLCPLGAIFAVISRVRLFRIKKPGGQCGSCRACTTKCVMGIPLYRSNEVTSGECIHCFCCVHACPRNNVSANPAPAVATVMTVGALTGLYYAGSLSVSSAAEAFSASASTESAVTQAAETGRYTDGVYTGSADGYRGTTQVSVTVENGVMTDIEVLSYGDDEEFFVKAESAVIADILESQSTDVDTVSGATFSSNGIINAVADALSSAGTDTPTDTDTSLSPEIQTGTDGDDSASSQASSSADSGASEDSLGLSDGVYTGSGTGFRGTTSVSVTISDGAIADITIVSYQDDEPYFIRAESAVVSEIISAQSVDVDTVSGATFSSNGILEAVANALGLDFTNPNSTLSTGGHGGRSSNARS
ncbi:MAG: hypothetical protein H6Q60_675 [Oscillospiraceae bacterium]|nr:hypothetical protein [Oscillospiraceae bacterium]